MNHLIINENVFGSQGVGAVYDGKAILYIPGDKPGAPIVHSFNESEARGAPSRPDKPAPKNVQVKITHARTINMLELATLVQGRCALDGNLNQALNALNVAIKYHAQIANPSRSATFYIAPKGQPKLLGSGLEVWQGYFTAIRPGIKQIFMNFDRAAGAFKQSGNSINVLLQVLSLRDPRDLELDRMEPRKRILLKRFLKNLTVALRFSRNANAKYKIRRISDKGARDFVFDLDEGKKSDVATYIEERYRIKLQYPQLPCVQLTKIAWYPLECVSILPGTQFLGKLNPDQVTEMLKFTTMKPKEALGYLREGIRHLQLSQENRLLEAWNLQVAASRPISAKARILESPAVVYGDGRGGSLPQQARDGQWETRGKKALIAGKGVERWFVVVFADDNPGRDGFPKPAVQQAVTDFVRACRDWGAVFSNTQPYILHVGNTMDVSRALRDAGKRAGYGVSNAPQFVLTFIPKKSSLQYPLIKAACETVFQVPSQNLLIQKMRTAKSQYWSNVALKVNVKLGGTNQRAGDDRGWLPGFDKNPTIVFGADVTHPGPGSLLPSIAGVVASFDPYGTQYLAEARAQNSREEMIEDLEEIAFNLIKNFGKKTGIPPARILFFRDGVAESQFDEVCRKEISAIKKACSILKPGYNPSLTYVICGKRHHIRMYPEGEGQGDRSGNCHAGTVIDGDITHPYYADFYLMSHAGLLGTSRPTHYTVLLDEAKLGPDQLQAIAYHLAHIYARSTRSVSIASPAYYAHHVCFRARHHVGDDDQALSDMGSANEEQIDRLRNIKLDSAREKLAKGVGPNLKDSLYFM